MDNMTEDPAIPKGEQNAYNGVYILQQPKEEGPKKSRFGTREQVWCRCCCWQGEAGVPLMLFASLLAFNASLVKPIVSTFLASVKAECHSCVTELNHHRVSAMDIQFNTACLQSARTVSLAVVGSTYPVTFCLLATLL